MNLNEKIEKWAAQVEIPCDMSDKDISQCLGFADGFLTAIASIAWLLERYPGLKLSLGELEDFFVRHIGNAVKGYAESLTSK